jgi:hypothetical protein
LGCGDYCPAPEAKDAILAAVPESIVRPFSKVEAMPALPKQHQRAHHEVLTRPAPVNV